MKKKLQPYASPASEVVEICPRGFLCDSPNDYNTQMDVKYTEVEI